MKKCIKMMFIIMVILPVIACSKPTPLLKGFYQSDMIGSECVQISIDSDENKFVEYISNREVNTGTYRAEMDGTYIFDGDLLDFSITFSSDNTFEIILPKLNGEIPIILKNIGQIPTLFSTQFNDIKEYKDFLK